MELCNLRYALLLVAMMGAGCQKKPDQSEVAFLLDPDSPKELDLSKEDPEVLAHFKKKGWRLHRAYGGPQSHLITLEVDENNDVNKKSTLTEDDYKMLARSKTLQVLSLARVNCTDVGLKRVAAIPHLKGIYVSGEDVTDAGIKALADCKTLENVTLFQTPKVTDAGIKELAALPKLQLLDLRILKLIGSAFEDFAKSKDLTTLHLKMVEGLNDEGAGHIAKIPNLRSLKIGSEPYSCKVTTKGIKAIVDTRLPANFEFAESLLDDALFETLVSQGWLYGPSPEGEKTKRPATATEVRFISIDGSSVTDKGFASVLDCTNTETIAADGTGLTDETIKKLANFKKLNSLFLARTKVTGTGLNAISHLPIKWITLRECELTEDAFKALGKMSHLESLNLSEAKMKAEWIQHLARLPKLKDLNLYRVAFDDTTAEYLLTMPNLKTITLDYTQLGDTGFLELLKHPQLESLFLNGTKITKEVYLKAKKDYPKRRITFDRYD